MFRWRRAKWCGGKRALHREFMCKYLLIILVQALADYHAQIVNVANLLLDEFRWVYCCVKQHIHLCATPRTKEPWRFTKSAGIGPKLTLCAIVSCTPWLDLSHEVDPRGAFGKLSTRVDLWPTVIHLSSQLQVRMISTCTPPINCEIFVTCYAIPLLILRLFCSTDVLTKQISRMVHLASQMMIWNPGIWWCFRFSGSSNWI